MHGATVTLYKVVHIQMAKKSSPVIILSDPANQKERNTHFFGLREGKAFGLGSCLHCDLPIGLSLGKYKANMESLIISNN